MKQKAIVLMYHRIADVETDPWELAVSPANFEGQLQVLKRLYKPVPVNDLCTQLGNHAITGKSVCLTFDDGYQDNFLYAKPLLEKYQCPAVFFIPSRFIGNGQRFWWDELQAILLSPAKLPVHLSVSINGELLSFHLGNEEELSGEQWAKQKKWVWPAEPPTLRCKLYLDLWEKLKPLPYNQIGKVVAQLREWAHHTDTPPEEELPMTSRQLADLKNHSWIDIGIHTVSHPALSYHTKNNQQKEITECRQYLERIFGKPADTMAYPYGDYNELTLEIVNDQKLKAVFTTEERTVTKNSDPFRLGRFQVRNWTGKEFEERLTRWIREY